MKGSSIPPDQQLTIPLVVNYFLSLHTFHQDHSHDAHVIELTAYMIIIIYLNSFQIKTGKYCRFSIQATFS